MTAVDRRLVDRRTGAPGRCLYLRALFLDTPLVLVWDPGLARRAAGAMGRLVRRAGAKGGR
ncbi:hypothetical protein QCN29_04465 [Streptomyces sp. HNM0663]|uniref:Uncharacterized protein n=1 Tax=Streptomyces chengmaiensis TaxID=3040919 RepID=A0ABT6HID5_9ACTN|nr:hypothetical protein [Streptomyces chengmaiensis]MDH2388052.1 hypothetical protein [Streptomyces chengmaiensis]